VLENKFRVWDTVENIWQDDLYLSMNGFLRWFNGDYLDLTSGEMVIQFSTGIKDMNDKMIFEGDILKDVKGHTLEKKEQIGIVKYGYYQTKLTYVREKTVHNICESSLCRLFKHWNIDIEDAASYIAEGINIAYDRQYYGFYLQAIKDPKYSVYQVDLTAKSMQFFEIIGNIYDNPELLKKEN
jgi:uncharacterized phage protein (TIGR01671 family)